MRVRVRMGMGMAVVASVGGFYVMRKKESAISRGTRSSKKEEERPVRARCELREGEV